MSKTVDFLKTLTPYNEQERVDIETIIKAEKIFGNILTRDNLFCHLTSSAFVINKEKTKCLCVYHNIYKSWTWPGGHADGDDDMLYVAKKELIEETSVKNFKVLNNNNPISIDILPVASHIRKGKYVPCHTHLSFAYLFEADEKEATHILEDENSNVGWLDFNELIRLSTEPHMIPAYKKVIERIKLIKK